jgi:hypothetical protein
LGQKSNTHHGRSAIGRHFASFTRRRSRVVDGQISRDGPLGSADALSRLIQFGRHIEIIDLGLLTVLPIETDQRVDLQIRKVEIDVDGIESRQKVDHRLLLVFFADVGQQGGSDGGSRGEVLAEVDVELEGFRVDVADFDAAFVGEEDGVAFAGGGDADVVFGVGWVGEEGFDDEGGDGACDGFHLEATVLEEMRT